MIPSNIYPALTTVDASFQGWLPLCHTAMIPWTAEFVSDVIGGEWYISKAMKVARENAKIVYGL